MTHNERHELTAAIFIVGLFWAAVMGAIALVWFPMTPHRSAILAQLAKLKPIPEADRMAVKYREDSWRTPNPRKVTIPRWLRPTRRSA